MDERAAATLEDLGWTKKQIARAAEARRGGATVEEAEKAARIGALPLSFVKVVGAVILGNLITGLLAALGWYLLTRV